MIQRTSGSKVIQAFGSAQCNRLVVANCGSFAIKWCISEWPDCQYPTMKTGAGFSSVAAMTRRYRHDSQIRSGS